MANTQGLQGFLPDPVLRPKECLEALIMRIAATDKEGFFMVRQGSNASAARAGST